LPIKPENYKRVRDHIFKLLGRACVGCGSVDELEFDHIVPTGYARRDKSSERVWEWLESYDQGNLQILCKDCNREKGDNIDE
jgi:5-methylcytosine-specific restriction endonuclease McrA